MSTTTVLSPATRAGSSSAAASATEDATRLCAACPHPMAAHDAIGTRFCSATAAGGFARGCVCST
jgi:hypothetical protein